MQSIKLPNLLYRYFSQTGEVTIPNIGNLVSIKRHSINDFVSRELRPVAEAVNFNPDALAIKQQQYEYLEKQLGSESGQVREALVLLGEELHQKLHVEKKLEWMGVGSFFVDESGKIQFQPKTKHVEMYKPIHYQHVIRKDAVYEMRVGEENKSTIEMETFFEDQKKSIVDNQWKIGALILVGVIIVSIFVRYSKGNFSLLDGRYNKIEFKAVDKTYRKI